MARIKRIQRQRVADEVYAAIREAIVDQVFQPGERLDIPSLAEKFDVSLMPVRQAIQKLSSAGLVEIRPRSGTFVARVTPHELAETFDIRRALECLAAETTVENVTQEHLEEMRELLEKMRGPLKTEQAREQHDKRNTRFHRLLVQLSSNRKLMEMYDALDAHIKIARVHLRTQQWAERLEREDREHQEIVSALSARNRPRLVRALANHIDLGKKALIADLEEAVQNHEEVSNDRRRKILARRLRQE